jgi:phosphohistidine phosphatase
MRLWIVRHGIASDAGPPTWADADRALTPEGRREFRGLARHLAERGRRVDTILSSPLVRARQTAAILSEEMSLATNELEVTDLIRPGFDLERLVRHLDGLDAENVAIVGHQPDLGFAASTLVGGGSFAFGKGHIAALRFDGGVRIGGAVLSWFVGPEIAIPADSDD